MRFLHTGDWHVGKTLRGRSRADEHRAVLTEIADIADDRIVVLRKDELGREFVEVYEVEIPGEEES